MSDHFPEEVIHEILLRLPVKSLIKCSTVCKSWSSLIKSSAFIDTHLSLKLQSNPQNDDARLLLLKGVTNEDEELYSLHNPAIGESTMLIEPSSLVVPRDTPRPCLDVIGTCNGLICISSQYAHEDVTILWNPCVRKFVNLSRRKSTTSEIVYAVRFAFGYDARTNDYKVLKFTNFILGFNLTNKVEVYSLARGCWRSLSAAVVADLASTGFIGVGNRVFLNGSLHSFENGAIWGIENFIVLFDMFSEEFFKMLVPPALAKERDPIIGIDISRHGESLAIVKIASSEGDNAIIHMWVMKEYDVTESWTELFTIRVEGCPRNFWKPNCFKPFGLRSGEIVLEGCFRWIPRAIKLNRLDLMVLIATTLWILLLRALSYLGKPMLFLTKEPWMKEQNAISYDFCSLSIILILLCCLLRFISCVLTSSNLSIWTIERLAKHQSWGHFPSRHFLSVYIVLRCRRVKDMLCT